MVLNEFRKLCKPGAFCLYNRQKGKVFFAISRNIAAYLSELIVELETSEHLCQELIDDREFLELIVLETYESIHPVQAYHLLRSEVPYWRNYIDGIGLKFYNKNFQFIEYKAKWSLAKDHTGTDRIVVEASTKRGNSIVVGVFDSIFEAKDFIRLYYSISYPKIVIANNEFTKRYLSETKRMLMYV